MDDLIFAAATVTEALTWVRSEWKFFVPTYKVEYLLNFALEPRRDQAGPNHGRGPPQYPPKASLWKIHA